MFWETYHSTKDGNTGSFITISFIIKFISANKTYVHGIVKNIWSGTLSASATWVCPEQVDAHSLEDWVEWLKE